MFKVMLGVLFFTIITLVVFLNLDPNIVQTPVSQISSLSSDFMTVGDCWGSAKTRNVHRPKRWNIK